MQSRIVDKMFRASYTVDERFNAMRGEVLHCPDHLLTYQRERSGRTVFLSYRYDYKNVS